jgi:hypothetical protein
MNPHGNVILMNTGNKNSSEQVSGEIPSPGKIRRTITYLHACLEKYRIIKHWWGNCCVK